MSNTAVQKCRFCEGKMFRKKQKKVSHQICNIWFHKKCTQLSGKDFKSISFKKNNSLCQSCFCKHVPFGSQRTTKFKDIFSYGMPFDDNGHHTFINSKHYDINELNSLNNKANYFGIHNLNIASLSKHIDSLSNVLSMMKFIFPIIGLCEHKIRSNSFINKISLPGYTFC